MTGSESKEDYVSTYNRYVVCKEMGRSYRDLLDTDIDFYNDVLLIISKTRSHEKQQHDIAMKKAKSRRK